MEITDHGPIRVLCLDRPQKLNAFNAELAEGASDALVAAVDDESVGGIVVTGSGRAFSAGIDLDWLSEMATEGGDVRGAATVDMYEAIDRSDKPVIAAVNGLAVGVGTTVCLHVDLVVASESARFQLPFTKLGVAPELGSSWLLPQQVGYQRAAWMLLSSEWVDATSAVEHGLALEVVADDQLIGRAVELAGVIARHGADGVAAAKRTLRAWRKPAIDAAVAAENAEFSALLAQSSGFEIG